MLISSAIIAVAAGALLSVILSSRQMEARSDVKLVANLQAKKVLERLRTYVNGDLSMLPGTPPGHLDGDECGPACSGPGCYALEDCAHDVNSLLPADFVSKHGGTMTYQVTVDPDGGRKVTVTVTWTVPQT